MSGKVVPSQRQRQFQEWEFGIFCHFGIRTFHEGHRDWDEKEMNPGNFNPTALDCRQWAATAAKAGAKYMVLTAKHHDGFANWPSAHTEFSVANTPWRGGGGDVVREFVEACRLHGLKVGLYYSPAQWPPRGEGKDYDDYFIGQVSELLEGYGEIDMLWFDGCGSENHQYDWARIVGEIRRMQPDILIFNMGGDPDYRWVGNEVGLAQFPCWNTVDAVDFSIRTDAAEKLQGKKWLPVECDCMIRDVNWFWSERDEHTVKSPEELLGIYYYSVGRGANLLLNIGPDRRGLLPEKDISSLKAMGDEVKRRFGEPLAELKDFTRAGDAEWVLEPAAYKHCANEVSGTLTLDHIVLQEDLSNGESVRRFKISIVPYLSAPAPITVFEGYNIGHKAICHFPLIRAKKIIVQATEYDQIPELRSISAYKTC
ncbi:MAG: alpha-L-fucosidase [Victivallales bacterium]|nr:alpha-L-fucosidase [Victivallales bacterium]